MGVFNYFPRFKRTDARITPCDLQQATYGSIVQRKVRTSENPGKEVKGFVDLIRHLPDETKGPFIDKLVKNDQDRTRQLVRKVRLAQILGDVYLQLVSGVNVTYGNEGTSKSQNEAEWWSQKVTKGERALEGRARIICFHVNLLYFESVPGCPCLRLNADSPIFWICWGKTRALHKILVNIRPWEDLILLS